LIPTTTNKRQPIVDSNAESAAAAIVFFWICLLPALPVVVEDGTSHHILLHGNIEIF